MRKRLDDLINIYIYIFEIWYFYLKLKILYFHGKTKQHLLFPVKFLPVSFLISDFIAMKV